jgi:hypothetical protein
MIVQNGGIASETFSDATDTTDATYPVQGLCGDRNYAIYDDNAGTNLLTWITVTKDTPSAGVHTIEASPYDPTLVTGSQLNLYLRITYTEYPSHAGKWTLLPVTVTDADCDCELLTWDLPTRLDAAMNVGDAQQVLTLPEATINEASKSASQEILFCYAGAGCPATSTFTLLLDDGNAVPITASGGFITLNAENTQLTVFPTKPADVGTWTIFATQDTASGPNLNFEAI